MLSNVPVQQQRLCSLTFVSATLDAQPQGKLSDVLLCPGMEQ